MEEAEFFNEIFFHVEDHLNFQQGNLIKCSVVVETLQAMIELDEIIFELSEHYIVSLNMGT